MGLNVSSPLKDPTWNYWLELFDLSGQAEARIERAVLVQLNLGSVKNTQDAEEFKELVRSAGAETTHLILGSRQTPSARFFVGKGKAEEIKSQRDN